MRTPREKRTNTRQAHRKVWFITGTSSGFGCSLVEELIERGQRVVTKPQEIHSAVDSAIGHFGAIDVLVNNAGLSVVGALKETSESELRAVFEPMFFGAVATSTE